MFETSFKLFNLIVKTSNDYGPVIRECSPNGGRADGNGYNIGYCLLNEKIQFLICPVVTFHTPYVIERIY